MQHYKPEGVRFSVLRPSQPNGLRAMNAAIPQLCCTARRNDPATSTAHPRQRIAFRMAFPGNSAWSFLVASLSLIGRAL
jgi:hypothetical protein